MAMNMDRALELARIAIKVRIIQLDGEIRLMPNSAPWLAQKKSDREEYRDALVSLSPAERMDGLAPESHPPVPAVPPAS